MSAPARLAPSVVRQSLHELSRLARLLAIETERYERALDRCPDMAPWQQIRLREAGGDPTASSALLAARKRDESAARIREIRRAMEAGYDAMGEMAADGLDPGAVQVYETLYLDGETVREAERRSGVSRSTVYRLRDEVVEWLRGRPALVSALCVGGSTRRP